MNTANGKITITKEELSPRQRIRIEVSTVESQRTEDQAFRSMTAGHSSSFSIRLIGILLVPAILVALWLSRSGSTNPHWAERIARLADRSVVRIVTSEGKLGTGFVVASHGDQHLILTNRHVVAHATSIEVAFRAGASRPGAPRSRHHPGAVRRLPNIDPRGRAAHLLPGMRPAVPFDCWTENRGCSAYGCANVNVLRYLIAIHRPPNSILLPMACLAASGIGFVLGLVYSYWIWL